MPASARRGNDDKLVPERLGRLPWYTVEFGLIRSGGEFKVYGSGVIGSHGERTDLNHGPREVSDFNLDSVLETPVKVDELQKVLFALESSEQIYEPMQGAEKRFRETAHV